MFSVSSGALHKPSRVASLSNEVRGRLEQRWAAYATRRGPLAVLDQADKLARLLAAGDDRDRLDRLASGEDKPSDSGREGALLFARVIGHTWRLEGELMNPVVNAYERRRPAPTEVSRMVAELSDLSVAAGRAADVLRGYATGQPPTGS